MRQATTTLCTSDPRWSGHCGRPSSPRPRFGAAAVAGAQRVLLGVLVNLAALMAWAAETLDRRHGATNPRSTHGRTP